jgi:accessory gene regulator protein AgrB
MEDLNQAPNTPTDLAYNSNKASNLKFLTEVLRRLKISNYSKIKTETDPVLLKKMVQKKTRLIRLMLSILILITIVCQETEIRLFSLLNKSTQAFAVLPK